MDIEITEQERHDREKPVTIDELIILASLVMSRLTSHTLNPGVFVENPDPDFVRENRILLYKLNKRAATRVLKDYQHKEIV